MNTTTTDSTGALCSGCRIDPLDGHTGEERAECDERQRDPEAQAPLHHLPAHIGAEHRHLALSEVDVIGRDEDHHQRQAPGWQ
jgi:hypothetical protein